MGHVQRRWWWWGLLAVVLVGVIGRALWLRLPDRAPRSPVRVRGLLQEALREEQVPPVYGEVPAFTLTDQQERRVARETLAGRVWIADFIFTRCAGQCLLMATQMTELQRRLPPDILLVSFSVDPTWDTPARLAEYAARVQADGNRWHFLTGSQEDIYRLSREGFRLSVEAQGGTPAEPILHSVRLVLVDPAGRIRGYYDGTDADAVARLQRDAVRLLHGDGP